MSDPTEAAKRLLHEHRNCVSSEYAATMCAEVTQVARAFLAAEAELKAAREVIEAARESLRRGTSLARWYDHSANEERAEMLPDWEVEPLRRALAAYDARTSKEEA